MIILTLEVLGTELSAGALALFVEDLSALPDAAIAHALVRCRRELRGRNGFPPTLTIADILDRAGVVTQAQSEEAEARAAWDALLLYADKHIVRDPHGSYVPKHYFGMTNEIPELDRVSADTLRRIGGWRAVKSMTEDDYPFVQKRFYEEYRAWNATNDVLMRGALDGNPLFEKLLLSNTMPDAPLKRLREG